ncbi:Aminoacylase-1 [Zancudomyces culisetae]|uniref:N-acyl-aliphatic-L-amino acid amidohydrolase n=1 Tax=Zancudomyces culisetae TaxID=1213189 RepID=A0A1R1PR89_ZANCU|nr:Aminoacylase-1 [Zancudomyces culisetae]|eukprot:OMH83486.1 Aminoacylase-1 [Zancudomyces culisetae]
MTITEPQSVARFRKYLQVKTVHPTPDYYACKPIVILKLEGSDPTKKSILLSSHTDVVPVFEDKWTYDPFGAERVQQEDGDFKIYARGSQDMKVSGSCHLEALREIKNSGVKLLRNVYAIYSPDEEIGGADGVQALVQTKEFDELNAGFDLDEGVPMIMDKVCVWTAERLLSTVKFTAHGNTGHGSQFIEGTAIEKLLPVINGVMALRDEELAKLKTLKQGAQIAAGEVTAINLTMLEGGKQQNVVPATYSVTFDIRISPKRDAAAFRQSLIDLAAKNGVECEFKFSETRNPVTNFDTSDAFMSVIDRAFKKHGLEYVQIVCPGATDARFIRLKGIPAVGFCPMINHDLLAHDHDEYVLESQFLNAINVYVDIISEMANIN